MGGLWDWLEFGASTSRPSRAEPGRMTFTLASEQGTVTFWGPARKGCWADVRFCRWDSQLRSHTPAVRQALEPSSLRETRNMPAHTHTCTPPRCSDLSMICRNLLHVHTQLIGVGHVPCTRHSLSRCPNVFSSTPKHKGR